MSGNANNTMMQSQLFTSGTLQAYAQHTSTNSSKQQGRCCSKRAGDCWLQATLETATDRGRAREQFPPERNYCELAEAARSNATATSYTSFVQDELTNRMCLKQNTAADATEDHQWASLTALNARGRSNAGHSCTSTLSQMRTSKVKR